MRVVLGGVVAVLTLFPARPAEACSCPEREQLTLPADGAVDVPTNAEIYYRTGGYEGDPDYYDEASLRSSDGEVVELTLRWHDDLQVLVPTVDLAPGTRYEIVKSEQVRSSFTTGAGHSTVEPLALRFDGLELRRADISGPGNSCSGDYFAFVAVEVESDPRTVSYSVHYESGLFIFDGIVLREELEALDGGPGGGCHRFSLPVEGSNGCLTLTARALDGSESETIVRCDDVEYCADTPADEAVCEPETSDCTIATGRTERSLPFALAGLFLAAALWMRRRKI